MKILIVEDDLRLSRIIERCLRPHYETDTAFDGAEAFFYAQENVYDLIVLDLMLPEMDGYTVLERLRAAKVTTPVLILSAKSTTEDKIMGFKVGADDYLSKPFNKEELLLRIDAILRRSLHVEETEYICFRDLVLKPKRRQAFIDGEIINLKGKQYDALEYLVCHKDTLITKKQLFDKIWGFMSDTSSNVVEVYISNLRKQLKPSGYDKYLQTVRGVGYLFSEEQNNV